MEIIQSYIYICEDRTESEICVKVKLESQNGSSHLYSFCCCFVFNFMVSLSAPHTSINKYFCIDTCYFNLEP